VLTSRCIDRPTRPLFPDAWRYETQIIALVLSADQENETDVIASIAGRSSEWYEFVASVDQARISPLASKDRLAKA